MNSFLMLTFFLLTKVIIIAFSRTFDWLIKLIPLEQFLFALENQNDFDFLVRTEKLRA